MFFIFSPSSKVSQLPSEEELDRATMMSTSVPTPAGLVTTSSTNNVVPTVRQTTAVAVSSKDDTSIASGSSGCGSLTKKKSQGVTSGEINNFFEIFFLKINIFIFFHLELALTDIDPQSIITDSGISDVSETPQTIVIDRSSATLIPISSNQNLSAPHSQQQQQNIGGEIGHSRNSSNTSQVRIKIILA